MKLFNVAEWTSVPWNKRLKQLHIYYLIKHYTIIRGWSAVKHTREPADSHLLS